MAPTRLLLLASVLLATSSVALCKAGDKADVSTTKLVELISKKRYEEFVAELGKAGMDANQPDGKGRLAICEAVKTRDVQFVDSLIQYGATVNVKDISTGATPVELAFQQNSADIARVLLTYGADPDKDNKKGKKAREFASSGELKELLRRYDNSGAMAFEDAPGTWLKNKNDRGEQYWYNLNTKESRWNLPPSCAWQRVEFQSMPSRYTNYVTGQTVFSLPPALSWRRLRMSGSEVWYNWRANKTQHETPDEMPQYLLDEAMRSINVRWYNEVTKEFSWTDPKYHSQWRKVKSETDGGEFFYNVQTGESTWDAPEEFAWSQVQSEEFDGRAFWYNKKTGESSWEKPVHERWELHTNDL